jgi:hypothetical protein
MLSPAYVAALFVTYFLARVLDRRGRGGIFLPVLPLAFVYGASAFPAALFGVLVVGALLAVVDATSSSWSERDG